MFRQPSREGGGWGQQHDGAELLCGPERSLIPQPRVVWGSAKTRGRREGPKASGSRGLRS